MVQEQLSLSHVTNNNVTIQGISWYGCGSSSKSQYPGIMFYNSSNVVLQSSSFHNSTGQAIVLSKMSGIVSIDNCQFTQNSYNQVHGTALYYCKEINDNLQLQLIIHNCTFSHNSAVGSIIYFVSSINETIDHLIILNSVFSYNKGVPVYISHSTLHLKGDMVFEHNIAFKGGAIFSSNSVIVFKDNHQSMFYNNSAIISGGTLFLNHSKMHIGESSVVNFKNNDAKLDGGVIYSLKSIVSFSEHSIISFEGSKAISRGGAIYCKNCDTVFDKNSNVKFSSNVATNGGAIFTFNRSILLFDGRSEVTFTDHTAPKFGGAVYSTWYSELSFTGNTSVTFKLIMPASMEEQYFHFNTLASSSLEALP